MNIAENPNAHIAVEPMFGQANNDYYSDARGEPGFGPPSDPSRQHNSLPHPKENLTSTYDHPESGFLGDDYRGKSATSSQRTLRYNDLELV